MSATMKLSREAITTNMRKLANEAYAYGLSVAHDEYSQGYAAGVEDLARLLVDRDPAISDRLVAILRAAGLDRVVPPSSRR